MAETETTDRLRLEWRDPNTLEPNPANWRKHPAVQVDALRASLDAAGWAGAALYNERTGRLIDGHARRDEAIGRGESLPVLVGDWPEEQERLILATLDPIAGLAEADQARLNLLLTDLSADFGAGLLDADDRLDGLLGALNGTTLPLLTDPDEIPENVLTRADVPDALFPTDNDWQIPTLDLKQQADAVDLPVTTWGSVARTARMAGTWHFYTDDDRYTALWADPSPVVNTRCQNAVEPNFSIYEQTPRAITLYRVYQKRWIARWWQSQGVKIFVDLNVAENAADLNFLGVPDGWRAYATRGYTDRMEVTEREYEAACRRAGGDVLFLVYGGGDAVAKLCGRRGWVHVREHMDRVREARHGEG